jgi:hypothetical protein
MPWLNVSVQIADVHTYGASCRFELKYRYEVTSEGLFTHMHLVFLCQGKYFPSSGFCHLGLVLETKSWLCWINASRNVHFWVLGKISFEVLNRHAN